MFSFTHSCRPRGTGQTEQILSRQNSTIRAVLRPEMWFVVHTWMTQTQIPHSRDSMDWYFCSKLAPYSSRNSHGNCVFSLLWDTPQPSFQPRNPSFQISMVVKAITMTLFSKYVLGKPSSSKAFGSYHSNDLSAGSSPQSSYINPVFKYT